MQRNIRGVNKAMERAGVDQGSHWGKHGIRIRIEVEDRIEGWENRKAE